MSIDKTIERVKELHGIYMKRSYSLDETTTGWTELKTKQWEAFKTEALSAIMPTIAAYEQSQKKIEDTRLELRRAVTAQVEHAARFNKNACDTEALQADLDTANRRIKELEDEIDKSK